MPRQQPEYSGAAAVGVLITLGWPFLLTGTHSLLDTRDDLYIAAVEWAVTLTMGYFAFVVQRRARADFGIRAPGWRDFLCGIICFGGAMLAAAAIAPYMARPTHIPSARALAQVPLAVRALLVLTAGVCEEFLFRGFAIEELGALIRSRWMAAAVSAVAFAAGHFSRYGWSSALLLPGVIGVAITLLYLWRRNLPACMLVHAAVDAIALLVTPGLVRQ